MRSILLAGLIVAISASAAAALTLKSTEGATVSHWGAVTVKPEPADASSVKIEIAKVRTVGGVRPESFWIADKPEEFWVAEKRSKTASGVESIQWADSRNCQALDPIIMKLAGSRSSKASASTDVTLAMDDFETLSPCWLDRPPL